MEKGILIAVVVVCAGALVAYAFRNLSYFKGLSPEVRAVLVIAQILAFVAIASGAGGIVLVVLGHAPAGIVLALIGGAPFVVFWSFGAWLGRYTKRQAGPTRTG